MSLGVPPCEHVPARAAIIGLVQDEGCLSVFARHSYLPRYCEAIKAVLIMSICVGMGEKNACHKSWGRSSVTSS